MEISQYIFMLNQYLIDWSALCSSVVKPALADALSYIASLRKNAFKGSSFMCFSFPPGKSCCRCTVVFSRAACHTVEEWDLRGIPFKMGNHKAPKQAQVAALANCHLARAESIIISRIMGRGDSYKMIWEKKCFIFLTQRPSLDSWCQVFHTIRVC